MALATVPAAAQDLLARQAPVDKKLKAVDTLALRELIQREQAGAPSAQLYKDWNNRYAHRATELPDSFSINLKHFCMPTSSRIITSNFGSRWGRMHKGLDIKVYIGDTIRAAFDGKVRIVRYEANGYGNYVVIRHNTVWRPSTDTCRSISWQKTSRYVPETLSDWAATPDEAPVLTCTSRPVSAAWLSTRH